MDWKQHYQPPQANLWSGRIDTDRKERIHEITTCYDLTQGFPIGVRIGLLGFACDAGVVRNQGRAGAKMAPDAIRQALASYAIPVEMPEPAIADFGNIICQDDDLEQAQQALGECIQQLRAQNILPLIIGGGHETAWGHYLGLKDSTAKNLSIINFDAHYDLRELGEGDKGSSGTPFLQIANHCEAYGKPFNYTCFGIQPSATTQSLRETAESLSVKTFYASDIENTVTHEELNRIIYESNEIYLSICMDVFSMSVVPGVSAPQPLGILPHQMLPLYKLLLASGKVVALDIVELAPCFDSDHRSAKLAASLLWQALSL